MFPRYFRRSAESRISPTRRNNKKRPALETLEGKQLLSLGLGPEFPVNPPTQGIQQGAVNATSTNGSSVVVWTNYTGGHADILAQRYNSLGNKVGSEILVAYKPGGDDFDPAVAMDAFGDFVVSWTQDHSSGGTDVLAQKFNASGVPVNGVVPVGTGTFAETQARVGMDAWGDFVVAYTRNTNNNNPDVFAKRYNASSQLLGVITVAGSSHAETSPTIAMTPDGRFDIAYQYQYSSTDIDLYAARYTANGTLIQQTPVATSTALEEAPSIAMDYNGNAVIAYEKFNGNNWDIKARRLSNTGSLSGELSIASTWANETAPSVAMAPTGGTFVVGYNSNYNVFVSEVNAANTVTSTLNAGSSRFGASVSTGPQSQILLTYTVSTGNFSNIGGRRGHL